MRRHGRARPGHPRLSLNGTKNVDARDKPGHDEEIFFSVLSASLRIVRHIGRTSQNPDGASHDDLCRDSRL
jgi:hypothetical protein